MEECADEEVSRDQICIDMLASNNSEEFTPEMAQLARAQNNVDQSEEKAIDSVKYFYLDPSQTQIFS